MASIVRKAAFGLHWLVRTGLGVLFLYAGAVKMADPVNFVESIKAFELTGPSVTEALTYGVPALEVVAGLILAFGIRLLWRGAAILLTALLLVFSTAVAVAWWRDLTVSCGCFGAASLPADPILWLVRNSALAVTLLGLILAQERILNRREDLN